MINVQWQCSLLLKEVVCPRGLGGVWADRTSDFNTEDKSFRPIIDLQGYLSIYYNHDLFSTLTKSFVHVQIL